jgi:hypothetical protein
VARQGECEAIVDAEGPVIRRPSGVQVAHPAIAAAASYARQVRFAWRDLTAVLADAPRSEPRSGFDEPLGRCLSRRKPKGGVEPDGGGWP